MKAIKGETTRGQESKKTGTDQQSNQQTEDKKAIGQNLEIPQY